MKELSELVQTAVGTAIVSKDCHSCGKTFEVGNTPMAQYVKVCPACEAVRREQAAQREKQWLRGQRLAHWQGLCPAAYRIIDPSRLPNREAFEKVMAWKYGPDGLILHGESGRGKTRSAWALLAREHDDGRRISALDCMAGIRYAAKFGESCKLVEQWMDLLISKDILLLDDPFKNKLTDSFESAIFSLIDQRISQQRPTIVTTNDTGETLQDRLSQDRALPLMRRLREHCQTVQF